MFLQLRFHWYLSKLEFPLDAIMLDGTTLKLLQNCIYYINGVTNLHFFQAQYAKAFVSNTQVSQGRAVGLMDAIYYDTTMYYVRRRRTG